MIRFYCEMLEKLLKILHKNELFTFSFQDFSSINEKKEQLPLIMFTFIKYILKEKFFLCSHIVSVAMRVLISDILGRSLRVSFKNLHTEQSFQCPSFETGPRWKGYIDIDRFILVSSKVFMNYIKQNYHSVRSQDNATSYRVFHKDLREFFKSIQVHHISVHLV